MRVLQALVICGSLGSPRAWATSQPSKQSQEKAAKKACATRDYHTGIDILADLYVETNDPTYVYNQGRCYEQNSRFEEAIGRFREYLRMAPNLTAEDRADVQKHISDCEGLMPKSQPVVPQISSAPPRGQASQTSVESTRVFTPPPSNTGSGLRLAGLATASAGVAILVTGVALNLKHERLVAQNNNHFSRDRESNVQTYKTWSWVGYGVGAAAVLAGGTLWVLGRRSSGNGQQTVALLPMVDPHGAGCILHGGF